MQNQHYVPRVYLKSFTYDGSHLYIFDKATNGLMPDKWSTIKSAASELNFYTLPEALTQTGEADEVESWLQEVDGRFGALRSGVEGHVKSGYPIEEYLRKELSRYLGVQMVRTKMYREIMAAAYKIGLDEIDVQCGFDLVRPTREQMTSFHASHMREKMAPIISEHLESRLWFLGLNETQVTFFTSDSPVVLQEFSSSGTRTGDMIAFPITPRCILMMYDGEITAKLSRRPFQHWMINQEEVNELNALQLVPSSGVQPSKSSH